MISDVNEQEFNEFIKNSEIPVLVDFWAPWCGPCRQMAPALKQLDAELSDTVKIIKVNVDEETALASKYNINGLPTFVLFSGGEQTKTKTGAQPLNALKQFIGA